MGWSQKTWFPSYCWVRWASISLSAPSLSPTEVSEAKQTQSNSHVFYVCTISSKWRESHRTKLSDSGMRLPGGRATQNAGALLSSCYNQFRLNALNPLAHFINTHWLFFLQCTRTIKVHLKNTDLLFIYPTVYMDYQGLLINTDWLFFYLTVYRDNN